MVTCTPSSGPTYDLPGRSVAAVLELSAVALERAALAVAITRSREPLCGLAVRGHRGAAGGLADLEKVLGLRSGLSPAARAHAGPRAKLDKRLLNGSFSESLTARSLESDFGNDKLRVAVKLSGFSGRQKVQNPPRRALVSGEQARMRVRVIACAFVRIERGDDRAARVRVDRWRKCSRRVAMRRLASGWKFSMCGPKITGLPARMASQGFCPPVERKLLPMIDHVGVRRPVAELAGGIDDENVAAITGRRECLERDRSFTRKPARLQIRRHLRPALGMARDDHGAAHPEPPRGWPPR